MCPNCRQAIVSPPSFCPACDWVPAEFQSVPLTAAQRWGLFKLPASFAGTSALLWLALLAGIVRFGGFPAPLVVLAVMAMLPLLVAALLSRSALLDLKRGAALDGLLPLRELRVNTYRRAKTQYLARFGDLHAFEVHPVVFRALREGRPYWVTFSPHSWVCWEIRPE